MKLSLKFNNPHKNSLITNINEVEKYDLTYENHIQNNNNNENNENKNVIYQSKFMNISLHK